MSVTVSQPQNIRTIDGNGFAIYKDSITNKFMVKDVNGQTEEISSGFPSNVAYTDVDNNWSVFQTFNNAISVYGAINLKSPADSSSVATIRYITSGNNDRTFDLPTTSDGFLTIREIDNNFTASQTIKGLRGQGGGIGIKLTNTTPTTGKTYEVLSYDIGEFAVRSTDGGIGQILRYNETTGWNFETAGATGSEDALFGGFVTVNGDLQVFGGTVDYVLLSDTGITFDRSNSFLKPSKGNIRNLHIGGSSSGNNDWQSVKVYTNDQDDFTWNDGIVARQNVDNNFSVDQTFQGDISADNITINTLGKITINTDSTQAGIEIKRSALPTWDLRHTDSGLTFFNQAISFKALQLINDELFSRGLHYFDAGIDVTGTTQTDNISVNQYVDFGVYQSSDLPTSEVTSGTLAVINDGTDVVWRGTIVGGGSETCLIMYDGTNWIYT